MASTLSSTAFKFLQSITKKSGFDCTDEEIHDMGIRLLTLCDIAAKRERERITALSEFTPTEIQAMKVIEKHEAATGNTPSARELSRALRYKSSRSGHMMLKRLPDRCVLVRRGDSLALGRKVVFE